MNEFGTLLTDRPAWDEQPGPTAAQKALIERKALIPAALLHGVYYSGLFGDTKTVGRWHGRKRRFVVWEHDKGQPKMKAAMHVADPGTGARFAPLARLESEGEYHISDFSFETTH